MTRPLFRLLAVGVVLVVWEAAVQQSGALSRYPHPLGIAEAAMRMLASGRLVRGTGQSLTRVLVAFVLAGLVGVALGMALGVSRRADRALSPIVDGLRSIAPIAWIPMAILWFGITGNAAIFIVAYAAVFPFILNAAQAVRLIDRTLVRAALTLGAGRALLLRRVVLPNALPTIVVGARISMGLAWASIIAAELTMGLKLDRGSTLTAGLGQLMVNTLYLERDVNGLVLYMAVIGLIGLGIDQVMRRVHRAVTPWTV